MGTYIKIKYDAANSKSPFFANWIGHDNYTLDLNTVQDSHTKPIMNA